MRKIERTSQFRRDYKREARGRHRTSLDADLVPILVALAEDQPLEPRHHDHALSGDWRDHRDCHVKPDLVLIYQNARPPHCAATLRRYSSSFASDHTRNSPGFALCQQLIERISGTGPRLHDQARSASFHLAPPPSRWSFQAGPASHRIHAASGHSADTCRAPVSLALRCGNANRYARARLYA